MACGPASVHVAAGVCVRPAARRERPGSTEGNRLVFKPPRPAPPLLRALVRCACILRRCTRPAIGAELDYRAFNMSRTQPYQCICFRRAPVSRRHSTAHRRSSAQAQQRFPASGMGPGDSINDGNSSTARLAGARGGPGRDSPAACPEGPLPVGSQSASRWDHQVDASDILHP